MGTLEPRRTRKVVVSPLAGRPSARVGEAGAPPLDDDAFAETTPLADGRSGSGSEQPATDPIPRPARSWGYRIAVAIGAIGRVMITVGVLTLLFVVYQLWGTGLQEARHQDALESEFDKLINQPLVTTTTRAAPSTTAAPEAPTTTAEPVPEEVTAAFERGDAVARIRADKIGLDKIVVEGVAVEDLRKGPGHYRSTPMPGQQGNAAIAGHRTTYGAPFGDIDKLEPGDEVVVTTPQGQFTYVVMPQTDPDSGAILGHLIVYPTDVWVLDNTGDNRLTLTACHPKLSARQRIVVQALLKEPPAPTPKALPNDAVDDTSAPADDSEATGGGARDFSADLNQGLGGDPSARNPAIIWGVVLAALLLLTGLYTRRWGRLRSWAAAAVPIILVLYVFFAYLDRWLPVT